MAKCIERESVAKYQFVSLRLINSSACFFETLNFSHTARHPFLVMTPMQSLFFNRPPSPIFPCLPPQASDKKASFSASSSARVMFSRDDEDRKKRGNAHAGVDNAMPTDSKWNQISVESNSVSVEASDRFHDDGQLNFRGQVHYVYSILTKFFCFP